MLQKFILVSGGSKPPPYRAYWWNVLKNIYK